jgi:Homeobox KN domain
LLNRRKIWLSGDNTSTHRPIKRLFTPEIKKMLKEWLVRRRENPYPTRDEKKTLAIDTGLTYTQICNWFANWRRKLKNSGREPQKTTWGSLIKSYNDNARGNVEQFSISSNDSIWSDTEMQMANNVPRTAHPKIDLKKVRRKRQPKLMAHQDFGKTTTSFLDQMHLPVLGTGHPDNQFMQKFMGGPMIYDQFYKNCQRFSAQAINNLPQPQCFQVRLNF